MQHFLPLGRHITLSFYPLASLQLHAQKMVAYSNMRIVRILSYHETALVQVSSVASKKQLAEYSERAKDADGFISSLIFVKGWLIGPRSRDSSFFNYKKLLLPCRKSTVNIKSKFFIALFYLYLFALQKFLRQPNQKILLIFYIPPKMDKI